MNGNGKIQSWLTPALMAASMVLLAIIWTEVRTTQATVQTAMERLAKHETALEIGGLLKPRKLEQ